jgi:hypothetical protein
MGAMGADRGPPQLPAVASVRELGGGHAPVVAVLLAAAKELERMAVPKGNEAPGVQRLRRG